MSTEGTPVGPPARVPRYVPVVELDERVVAPVVIGPRHFNAFTEEDGGANPKDGTTPVRGWGMEIKIATGGAPPVVRRAVGDTPGAPVAVGSFAIDPFFLILSYFTINVAWASSFFVIIRAG